MENDNIYEYIKKIFGEGTGKLDILDRQIPLEKQIEYLERSQNDKKELHEKFDKLEEEKQISLAQELLSSEKNNEVLDFLTFLSKIDKVWAYRLIEKFEKEVEGDLKDWAYLALKDSRMRLESYLLDESSIMVASGLGGENGLLRFFVVLVKKDRTEFSPIQQSILQRELNFKLEKEEGVNELIEFSDFYAKITLLLPLKIAINTFFKQLISACNELALNLEQKFLITNVKILSDDEIISYINKSDAKRKKDEE